MPQINATVHGPRTMLFKPNHDGQNKLIYFPDEPPAIISQPSDETFRFLMVACNYTVLMEGPTLHQAQYVKTVLEESKDGAFDNDYAGITSVFPQPNGDLLGFYHAETKHGTKQVKNYKGEEVTARYWSIGMAILYKGGEQFQKLGQILKPNIELSELMHEHQGIGDVCMIENAKKNHLYAYYTDITRKQASSPVGIAMARCDIATVMDRQSWRKCSDIQNGRFDRHGLGGEETQVVTKALCDVSQPHVTYIAEWQRYLMVCCVLAHSDVEPKTKYNSGIFFCHSCDGIKWEALQLLFHCRPIPEAGLDYTAHPCLYLPEITDDSASGYLIYCYSEAWRKNFDDSYGQPHYMCCQPITITHVA